MVTFNFQELLDEAGPTGDIPDGVYDAECTQAEAKIASTGKPMVVARFKVIAGPQANRTIMNNFVISQGNQNALRWFFQHMAVFGMNRDYFVANPPLEQVAANMIGKVARLTLATKEGRQNVANVHQIPGGAPQTAAPQVYAPPAQVQQPAPVIQQPVAAQPAPALAPQVQQPVAPVIQEPVQQPPVFDPQQAQVFDQSAATAVPPVLTSEQLLAQQAPQNGAPTPDAPPQIPF